MESDLVESAVQDFLDSKWTNAAVAAILAETASAGFSPQFTAHREGNRVRVHTNVDFSTARGILAKGDTPTEAHVLSILADFRRQLQIAAALNGELFLTDIGARLLQTKLGAIATGLGQPDVALFQAHVLGSSTAIREAVNSGQVPLSKALAAVEDSERFKKWLSQREPDAHLLNEYISEVSHQAPFDKLDGRVAKFLIFAGAGVMASIATSNQVGLGLGVALNALDTFVFDKLTKKWSPSAFVAELQQTFSK